MSSIQEHNSNIAVYLENSSYKNDKNKHKIIMLWASRFYKHINFVLRTYSYEEIAKDTIWAKQYTQEMIKYFYENGIYKNDLLDKNIDKLYRGYSKDFSLSGSFDDTTFIATSLYKHTAATFADPNGNIIVFNVDQLPNDVPFVLIDDTIAEYLQEDEVLLLPGKISLENKDNYIKATYRMNKDFIKHFGSSSRGGFALSGGMANVEIPPNAFIDLCGKYVIWYRAIRERDVETLGWMKLPDKIEQCVSFFKDVVFKHDDSFLIKTNLIPEFQDLKKKGKNKTEEEKLLFKSYFVHMAIYDAKNKKVDVLQYGCPCNFSAEVYDLTRAEEIKKHIVKTHSWLS